MKGSSLPMNTIVILVIAILVMSALLFFFFGTFTPGADAIQAQQVIATVCGEYAARVQCAGSAEFQIGGLRDDLSSDDSLNEQSSRIKKLENLANACATTGIGACEDQRSLPSDTCMNICCATFCPDTE